MLSGAVLSCVVVCYVVLVVCCCTVLSGAVMCCVGMGWFMFLSCLVLFSCVVFSCLVLSCLVLSCVFSCLVSFLVFSCLVSFLVLSGVCLLSILSCVCVVLTYVYLVLSCLIFSRLAWFPGRLSPGFLVVCMSFAASLPPSICLAFCCLSAAVYLSKQTWMSLVCLFCFVPRVVVYTVSLTAILYIHRSPHLGAGGSHSYHSPPTAADQYIHLGFFSWRLFCLSWCGTGRNV